MGWAWLSVFLPSSIPPDITIRDKITLETSFCHLIFWGYSLFWGRNFFLNRSSQPLPVSRSQSTLCASLQPPLFFPHLTLCVPQRVAQAPPWLLSQRGAPSALHPPPTPQFWAGRPIACLRLSFRTPVHQVDRFWLSACHCKHVWRIFGKQNGQTKGFSCISSILRIDWYLICQVLCHVLWQMWIFYWWQEDQCLCLLTPIPSPPFSKNWGDLPKHKVFLGTFEKSQKRDSPMTKNVFCFAKSSFWHIFPVKNWRNEQVAVLRTPRSPKGSHHLPTSSDRGCCCSGAEGCHLIPPLVSPPFQKTRIMESHST